MAATSTSPAPGSGNRMMIPGSFRSTAGSVSHSKVCGQNIKPTSTPLVESPSGMASQALSATGTSRRPLVASHGTAPQRPCAPSGDLLCFPLGANAPRRVRQRNRKAVGSASVCVRLLLLQQTFITLSIYSAECSELTKQTFPRRE